MRRTNKILNKICDLLKRLPDIKAEEAGGTTRLWRTYQKEAAEYDTELLNRYNKSLDTVLIFVRTLGMLYPVMGSLNSRLWITAGWSLFCGQYLVHHFSPARTQSRPQRNNSRSAKAHDTHHK